MDAYDCPILCHADGLHEFAGGPTSSRSSRATSPRRACGCEVGAITPEEVALHVARARRARSSPTASGASRRHAGLLLGRPARRRPRGVKAGLRAAYRRLRDELAFDVLLFAHGDPIAGGRRQRWRRSPRADAARRSRRRARAARRPRTSLRELGRALLGPAAGGGQVVGEGVDVGERRARASSSVAAKISVSAASRTRSCSCRAAWRDRGRSSVLDDAAVCLCAIAVHGHLIARIRRGLTDPVTVGHTGRAGRRTRDDRPGPDRADAARRRASTCSTPPPGRSSGASPPARPRPPTPPCAPRAPRSPPGRGPRRPSAAPLLKAAARRLREHAEELAELQTREGGKPLGDSLGGVEAGIARDRAVRRARPAPPRAGAAGRLGARRT